MGSIGPVVVGFSILSAVVHGLGIVYAAHAVMYVRSSTSAIAWSLCLILFPWVTLPIYWVFGRRRFHGYTEVLRSAYLQHRHLVHRVFQQISQHRSPFPESLSPIQTIAATLSPLPLTSGNFVRLLIDGDTIYQTMLNAIALAKDYILLQSYIVQDDEIGNEFRKRLIAKSQQGVQVYLLYDGIGSHNLSKAYVKSLEDHQIHVGIFKSTKGRGNRFQINFRNHRKILVIDGQQAFVGGLNIGDEYLGKHPPLAPWRDTGIRLEGPAVQIVQSIFLSDWYWATRQIPSLTWQPRRSTVADQTVLALAPSPADRLSACTLFFVNAINQAEQRFWVASPYFVPDEPTLAALKLAALRGVDVRILLPDRPDHLLVYFCAFSYYTEMQTVGIKLYRYKAGFMHQKTLLIDDRLGGVGSINLDNRSFFLNFEIMVFVTSADFLQDLEKMFLEDFQKSQPVCPEEYDRRSLWFRLAARISRLLAPVL